MILAALLLAVLAPAAPQEGESIEQVLDAIRIVETGGEPNGGRDAVGDNGRSIGPFQIQRAYWIDAGVPGRWEQCRDLDYAGRVVQAYWRRYCPRAYERLDAQVLARVHNGGSSGHRRASTLGYWRRVEQELARTRSPEYAPAPGISLRERLPASVGQAGPAPQAAQAVMAR